MGGVWLGSEGLLLLPHAVMRTTLEIPMTLTKDLNVILMVLRPLLAIGIRRRRADGYLESLAYWERDNFVWNNNLRANERDGSLSEPYSFPAFWIEAER